MDQVLARVGAGETAVLAMTRTKNSSISKLLDFVLTQLPLHAEEGTLREALAENDLIASIGETGVGVEASALLVTLLRRQLEGLALLDCAELAQGRWVFVSFPASLLGRSIVETLTVSGQAILPPDYWEQGDHRPEALKDEQRALLHRIETERVRTNPVARPVRVVHVASAVIRLSDRFLLHRREDRERPGEKTHVLPGGRFSPSDLSTAELAAGPVVLRRMFDVASPLVDAHLDNTLIRELNEELGLRHGDDYSFQRWQRLPPYSLVAGAGNRHGYSEFGFQLYTLKLTPLGEVRLLDREVDSTALTWFSADELAASPRADGASAFVDVLHAAWGGDVATQLLGVPDSGSSEFAMAGESNTLDLPASPVSGLQIGKPGKERMLQLDLNEGEWHLLLLLGWHARGFVIHTGPDIRLLGGGWVRVSEDVARAFGRCLLSKFEKLALPLVEIRDGHYMRLRIEPRILMMGAGLFGYRVDGSNTDGGFLTVERFSVTTPWGELAGEVSRLPINGNTIRILRELQRGDSPEGLDGVKAKSWERNLRDQLAKLQSLGLRRLWSTKHNVSTLVEGLRPFNG